MKRSIAVYIGQTARRLGTLHYNQQGNRENSSFEYHPEWLAAGDRFTVDPLLQLVAGPQFHKAGKNSSVFHPAIADTEPDGWGRRVILRDHSKKRERERAAGIELEPLTGLDYLLAVADESRVGALRFKDNEHWQRPPPENGERTTPPIVDLNALFQATQAVESQTETESDLAYLRGCGTSLGGLRPKCTIIDAERRLAIGKFPSVNDDRVVTKGEILALQLAKAAGIDAALGTLIDADGIPVAVIRRFDRSSEGARIPYISAATMLGADADAAEVHTYTEIVDALRINGANAGNDIEELWRRIAFTILITNVDDHLRNHGFLHVRGQLWRLSPAFDLNPFPERQRELKTWISEETGPDATIDALMSVRAYCKITVDRAKTILGEVEAAVARWRKIGRDDLNMSSHELDAFAEAFEHRERKVARTMAGLP